MIQPATGRLQLFRRYFKKDKSFESCLDHFNQPFCATKLVSVGKIEKNTHESSRFCMLDKLLGPVLISLDDSDSVYGFKIYLDGYRIYSSFSQTQTYIEWNFATYKAAEEEYEKIMNTGYCV